jgi:cell wall-associated NlpC family hydrolase
LRVRTLSAFLSSLILLVIAAPAASASSPGGTVAAGTPTRSAPAAATAPHIHLSPITARTPRLSYNGPVYERTASGQIVPYSSATAAPTATSTPTAQASSTLTGGSSVLAATTPAAATPTPAQPAGPIPKPQLLVPGHLARYIAGLAAAPMAAPAAVQRVIWAANEIIGLPYVFGGGHASFTASGYDCSGTVSFALHGGSLLTVPEDSSEFEGWSSHGAGRWIAVFANPGHAYMDVAGLRLDTSAADDPSNQQGPRWRPLRAENGGYTIRHPLGL